MHGPSLGLRPGPDSPRPAFPPPYWFLSKPRLTIKKLNFEAMIKSAAGAASLDLQGSLAMPVVRQPSRHPWAPLQIHGGCGSSRLDHGLKV